jgi:SPP1 gp7 family putative phage head morphogenesis protein
MTSARSAFGVDLEGVVNEAELGPALEAIGLRNAGLIKGFTDDMIKRIQQDTLSAVLNGEGAKSLSRRIRNGMGVSDSRARLIARDQVAKLNGSLNKIRHQQAGLSEYIWRTSHDERVRKRHRACDGKRYKYGKPTGAENGLEPGQPIQCRCVAQAVVEFGGKEFQTQEAIRAPELPPEQATALAKAMKKRPWTAPIERGAAK